MTRFFLPWWLGHIALFQDNNANIHRALVVKELSMATTESWLYPIKSLWDGKDWRNGSTPVINTKSQQKMNANLDGNKCCDIAQGCRNNATANALCNQSKRRSNEIQECATFLNRQCICITSDLPVGALNMETTCQKETENKGATQKLKSCVFAKRHDLMPTSPPHSLFTVKQK